MNEKQAISATVLSSTVIRVPGAAHAASAPFILLLVEADDGRKMLGHFDKVQPPSIGSRVVSNGNKNGTLLFTIG